MECWGEKNHSSHVILICMLKDDISCFLSRYESIKQGKSFF